MIPVSPGELLDKITILQIKSERLCQTEPLRHVRHELEQLQCAERQCRARNPEAALSIDEWMRQLKEVNEKLWDIEDAVRDHEQLGRFDANFIDLARQVYKLNDARYSIKCAVNESLRAKIIEQKSHGMMSC